MLAAATSLLCVLAAAGGFGWTASAGSRARGRTEPVGDARASLGEEELSGALGASLQAPDLTASINYASDLLLRKVFSGPSAEAGDALRQTGRFELGTRLAPATRLISLTGLDWGLTDFSPLSAPGPALLLPGALGNVLLPSQRFVRTLLIRTSLGLTQDISPRLQLAASAGFQRSGGEGHDAVLVIPFQRGPEAVASLRFFVDRFTTMSLLADASYSHFGFGRDSLLSNLAAAWTLRATREVLFNATAGAALVRSQGPDLARAIYASGALGAAWNRQLSAQSVLRTSVQGRLLPGVDRLTALGSQALRGDAGLDLSLGKTRASLSGSAGRTVKGAQVGARTLRLELRIGRAVFREWDLEGGIAAAASNQAPFAGWQSQAFLGLRWSDGGPL